MVLDLVTVEAPSSPETGTQYLVAIIAGAVLGSALVIAISAGVFVVTAFTLRNCRKRSKLIKARQVTILICIIYDL